MKRRLVARLAAGIIAALASSPVVAPPAAADSISLDVYLECPEAYPAPDGFMDDETIWLYASTSARIRGSVVVTTGGRIIKSWDFSGSTYMSYTWVPTVGGVIVPGLYTVTARAVGADGVPHTDTATFVVSAKKLIRVVSTRKVTAVSAVTACVDETYWGLPTKEMCGGTAAKYQYGGSRWTTILDAEHYAPIPAGGFEDLHPTTISVAATFSQRGTKPNLFSVCAGLDCSADVSFSKSTSVSAKVQTSSSTSGVTWVIKIPHGNVLTTKTYTITTAYWALR